MMHRIRRAARRLRQAARFGGVRARHVPLRWVRRAEVATGDRLCLFTLLVRNGRLLPHSIDHIVAWRAAGYKVIVVAAVASLAAPVDLSALDGVEGVAIRANKGYDFGAWAAVIDALGERTPALATLALANDSVLGPSDRFGSMIERVDRTEADVIGLVESRQVRPHLQSFVLFFKPRALRAEAFTRFWGKVRSGGRDYVIDHYETPLLASFTAAGLRGTALFAAEEDGNPTLTRWRDLIERGFPFIKVQLLRDNPFGVALADWRTAAGAGGFDLARLDRQIAALKQESGAAWRV